LFEAAKLEAFNYRLEKLAKDSPGKSFQIGKSLGKYILIMFI